MLKFSRLRRHRIGLGLVARAVYILWGLLCLGLGLLALEGYELFVLSGIERDAIKGFFILLFIGGVILFYALESSEAAYVIWALACLGFGWSALEGYDFLVSSGITQGDIKEGVFLVFLGGLAAFYALMSSGAALLESKTYEKWFKEGKGGSARWGGVLAFHKYAWARVRRGKAPIFFGWTMHKYDPWPLTRKIGVDDKNHVMTIAQSRSGKSTTVIWPNLVKYPYPDSVFVLDPKGEHAVFTSRHRAAQGQRVYVLDPFNITDGKVERHCFNPLAEIDPASSRAKEDIAEIADAFVITVATSINEAGEHFRGLATVMIMGLIAHVLTTQPKEKHNLPEVYEYFLALDPSEDDEAFQGFWLRWAKTRPVGTHPARRRRRTLERMKKPVAIFSIR